MVSVKIKSEVVTSSDSVATVDVYDFDGSLIYRIKGVVAYGKGADGGSYPYVKLYDDTPKYPDR